MNSPIFDGWNLHGHALLLGVAVIALGTTLFVGVILRRSEEPIWWAVLALAFYAVLFHVIALVYLWQLAAPIPG